MDHLFLWVEGDDDERFVEAVFSECKLHHEFVTVQRYAGMKHGKVRDFLRSIERMEASCVFFGDMDSAPSVEARIEELRVRYCIPALFPVVVVCRVIEGWYLAGLHDFRNRLLWTGRTDVDVNQVRKDAFNAGRPARFRTRIAWIIELLAVHERSRAADRSPSYGQACAVLNIQ